MPTKTGKPYSSFYGNDLTINQSGNTGVDATVRAVTDGFGNQTAIGIADDHLMVRPQNADSTEAFLVSNKAANTVLRVDTINSKVQIGTTQTAANTQYAHFAKNFQESSGYGQLADTHYMIRYSDTLLTGIPASVALGSSTSSSFNDTNPATSVTIADTAMDVLPCYWYIMDNITIDAVTWFHAADTATGDSTAAHLMGYDIDTDNGSSGGDLTSGVVLADGGTITNAGYEQIYYQTMTVQSADVNAGKVILFTFAADTVNSDYTISATVKYHIR